MALEVVMSVIVVILMYGLWSSMFSLAKVALAYSPPIFLTSARMLLAGLILLSYLALTKRASFRLQKKQIFSLALLALFSIYLTNILEFWALPYLSAGKACFIYSLSPFFAAFFSYLHFGERINMRKWIGLSLGVVAFIPVLYLRTGAEGSWTVLGFLSWPALAIMAAALFSVYGWVILRLTVKEQMVSPLMANGMSMFFGGMLALFHSMLTESWTPLPVAAGDLAPFMGWTLTMTFISNIICYNLYGMMLKKFTATLLSFLGLVSPIFASFHGWLFLDEPISWVIFFSTAIVSLGLWIVYSAELKQGYIVKSKPTSAPAAP
jgi:drug/metabolite transporter (DMT)-like permease